MPPPSPLPFRCCPHQWPPGPGSIFSPSPLRHRPLPPFRHRPPPSLPSPLPSPFPKHPSSTPRHVLSRYPPAPRHRLSLGAPLTPSTSSFRPPAPFSLPAPFGQTRLNEGTFLTKVLCLAIFGQTEALGSAKQDRIEALRSVLFGRTVLKGRGVLGAGAEKTGRGAGREHVPKSERRF